MKRNAQNQRPAAPALVERMLEHTSSCFESLRAPAGTTVATLLQEMPQHYPNEIAYMRDSKFTPVSLRNLTEYPVLSSDDLFTYVVDPYQTRGYVLANPELATAKESKRKSEAVMPVMTVTLHNSEFKGYKQARNLRIRQTYSVKGVAKTWYCVYALAYGGIVSDFEHLEGGKRLWRSLVNTADRYGLKASAIDTVTGDWLPVNQDTPDEEIWSTTYEGRRIVLALEKAQD